MGYFGGGYKDYNLRNNDGYIWKVSYQTKYKDYILEPYYEFMSVEESDFDSGAQEPSNTTKEFGIKLSKAYSDKRKARDDFETFFDND